MPEPSRGGDVRPPAEVEEGAIPVDGDDFVLGELVEPFELERVVGEEFAGLVPGDDAPFEGMVGTDDFAHALLDGLDLVRGEGLGNIEVVVEAVVDGGPETDTGIGDQFAHGGGQDMGGRVAQHAERFRVAVGEEAHGLAVGEGAVQVDDFAVDRRGEGGAGETRADLGGEGGRAGARGQRDGAAVGGG